jgi:hypothetical protein
MFSWALVDLGAERDALFAQLGMPNPFLESNRTERLWRPSTYNQPFEYIAQEAITHLNDILRSKVFPVLGIEVTQGS